MAGYLSRGALDKKVEAAIQSIWNSHHRPVIEIMLRISHMRPKERDSIQHPVRVPSTASAHELMNSDHNITEDQETTVGLVIENGTKWDSKEEEVFLFSRNIPAPGHSNAGKGITRRREVDDDGVDDEGIPAKRQRREE